MKTVNITMNGIVKQTEKEEMTFNEVVNLAYDGNPPTDTNTVFTVVYRRGKGSKPISMLESGESVKIKEGMIFDVTPTIIS